MKKIILISGVALLWPAGAMAQVCTTPPSCDTLGYKQTASECTGQQMLKCPFDNGKVFCGGTAVDCSSFTLSSCDTSKGTCSSCKEGTVTKYKYTSCNTSSGYLFSGSDCVNACPGYNLSSCYSSRGTCTSCKSGSKTFYKYTSCNVSDGWCAFDGDCAPMNNDCPEHYQCSDFLTNNTIAKKAEIIAMGNTSTCRLGGAEYIFNTSCSNGRIPVAGRCDGKNVIANYTHMHINCGSFDPF